MGVGRVIPSYASVSAWTTSRAKETWGNGIPPQSSGRASRPGVGDSFGFLAFFGNPFLVFIRAGGGVGGGMCVWLPRPRRRDGTDAVRVDGIRVMRVMITEFQTTFLSLLLTCTAPPP